MKIIKSLGLVIICCYSLLVSGQVIIPHPIPCVEVTPATVGGLPSGVQATDCIESEGETVTFDADQNYSIKAGEFIEFDANTVIEPDASHQFHAFIQNNGMDLAWYAPNLTPGTVGLHEKLEIGVQFNDSIHQKIERFVNRETGEKLNPFNPEEVDLYAEFWVEVGGDWYGPQRMNGFYYNEFERNPSLTHYDTVDTPHDFRVRFAPTVLGDWRCQVKAVVDGYDTINAYEFTFNCVASSRKGYMTVGDNKRYFKRGNEPFFPVGQNLFGPSHDSSAESMSSIPEYFDYFNQMKELKDEGANYFRHIVCPWNTDIEFEHLGDYSNRMANAWEMDNIIDTAEVLDLVMHLNLAIHYTFEAPNGLHQQRFWDWARAGDTLANPVTPPEYGCFNSNDSGYCYRNELDLENPVDFFSDSTALSFYQKRLRYMVSRWGYSTNVGIMELLSETNHVGIRNTIEHIPDSACIDIDSLRYTPYDEEAEDFPETMFNWHHDLAEYLKEDLKMSNHPISVNYTGLPDVEHNDLSFKIPSVDVATYNEYRVEIDKYEVTYITVEEKIHEITDLSYADKPFMHSEYGLGSNAMYLCDQNNTFIKRAFLTPFTGLATAAITWDDQTNYLDTWKHLGTITEFMEGIPLNDDNYQAQKPIITSDKAVEALYLRNFDEDGYRAVGAVSNRTYNFFTQGLDSTFCSDIDNFQLVEDNPIYQTATDFIGADYEDVMILPDMGWVKHYEIQWYNALTGALIFTEGRWTNASHELKIEFPLLTGDATQPIILFKVYPWDESFLAPIEDDSIGVALSGISPSREPDKLLGTIEPTQWDNVQPQIQVSPNPTNSYVNVSINNRSIVGEEWQLQDGLGKTVQTGIIESTNFSIDLSVYNNGIYYLTFEKVNHVEKIIKH